MVKKRCYGIDSRTVFLTGRQQAIGGTPTHEEEGGKPWREKKLEPEPGLDSYFLNISHMKKGQPTAAVMTPTGSSITAMFLAIRSQSSRKTPPLSSE